MFYTFAEKNVAEPRQTKSKLNTLINDLLSGEEKKIAAAIKGFAVHGDASVIEPLTRVWRTGLSEENEAMMTELFSNMKDQAIVAALMEAFRNPENQPIQRKLVSMFWNSSLDFSAYLPDFILFAIEGDFLDAFEAITLIEQFEEEIPESAILESQLLLKEYFGGSARNEQKDVLLSDLAILLKRFEEEADSDGIEDYFVED